MSDSGVDTDVVALLFLSAVLGALLLYRLILCYTPIRKAIIRYRERHLRKHIECIFKQFEEIRTHPKSTHHIGQHLFSIEAAVLKKWILRKKAWKEAKLVKLKNRDGKSPTNSPSNRNSNSSILGGKPSPKISPRSPKRESSMGLLSVASSQASNTSSEGMPPALSEFLKKYKNLPQFPMKRKGPGPVPRYTVLKEHQSPTGETEVPKEVQKMEQEELKRITQKIKDSPNGLGLDPIAARRGFGRGRSFSSNSMSTSSRDYTTTSRSENMESDKDRSNDIDSKLSSKNGDFNSAIDLESVEVDSAEFVSVASKSISNVEDAGTGSITTGNNLQVCVKNVVGTASNNTNLLVVPPRSPMFSRQSSGISEKSNLGSIDENKVNNITMSLTSNALAPPPTRSPIFSRQNSSNPDSLQAIEEGATLADDERNEVTAERVGMMRQLYEKDPLHSAASLTSVNVANAMTTNASTSSTNSSANKIASPENTFLSVMNQLIAQNAKSPKSKFKNWSRTMRIGLNSPDKSLLSEISRKNQPVLVGRTGLPLPARVILERLTRKDLVVDQRSANGITVRCSFRITELVDAPNNGYSQWMFKGRGTHEILQEVAVKGTLLILKDGDIVLLWRDTMKSSMTFEIQHMENMCVLEEHPETHVVTIKGVWFPCRMCKYSLTYSMYRKLLSKKFDESDVQFYEGEAFDTFMWEVGNCVSGQILDQCDGVRHLARDLKKCLAHLDAPIEKRRSRSFGVLPTPMPKEKFFYDASDPMKRI